MTRVNSNCKLERQVHQILSIDKIMKKVFLGSLKYSCSVHFIHMKKKKCKEKIQNHSSSIKQVQMDFFSDILLRHKYLWRRNDLQPNYDMEDCKVESEYDSTRHVVNFFDNDLS